MKIRNGFVSNSSSSSFTCDVCGATESGMDVSLSDIQMSQCVNGHTFCDDHMTKKLGEADFPEALFDRIEGHQSYEKALWALVKDMPHDQSLIDKVTEVEGEDYIEDLKEELASESRYEMPASVCPCCTFEALADRDGVAYFLASLGKTKEQVLAEMKGKFGDWDKFQEYVGEKE